MLHCALCEGELRARELACPACDVQFRGDFQLPRLLRLSNAHLALAEALVMAGGNLKTLAQSLDISYPTLRKRIDDLMAELQALREADDRQIDRILSDIEAGAITPAKGTRLIRELNGGHLPPAAPGEDHAPKKNR